jgi:general secretion pathway protein A
MGLGELRKAFPTTPDRSCVYPATGAETALARLQAGLADGEGFLLLTGPAGTGKTLLVHRLLESLGRQRRSVLLTNSHFENRSALLQACLFDLELPHGDRSEQELRLTLTSHLLDTLTNRGSVILIVDEAQHLDADLLEELRLLGNLEAAGGHALQIVLVGLPEVDDHLAQPTLAALAQRLTTRVQLRPFDLLEAMDYSAHVLRTADSTALEVVPEEVREIVAEAAAGVPRRINQILREALRVADEVEAEVVDVEMIQEALVRLGLIAPTDEGEEVTTDPLAA